MSVVKTGEVVDVILTDDNLYAIKVILNESASSPQLALPLDASIKRIPLKGEIVLLYSSISVDASNGPRGSQLYYGNPIPIHQSPNNNAAPLILVPPAQEQSTNESYDSVSAGNPTPSNTDDTDHDLGEGFTEDSTISPLQPFLGDVLIEGRFGHSLRFGYTPDTTKTNKTPSWSSSNSKDPITILSNGRGVSGDNSKFIIEDIDDDKSSIWLSSTQKIRLSTSQNKLGTDVESPAQYDGAGITLNSDRILLNSKKDHIILSAKKSVNVATPSWAMDLDKLFTEIKNLVDNVIDLNDNLQKAHDEIARLAQSTATMTLTGNLGAPVGPPVTAPVILLSKGFSEANKQVANTLKQTVENIKRNIDNMKQS
tara:strand:+ start:195 stop:1301 length:1107 start_codon:yes stop_codon:yes gene_type:complete